MLDTTNETTAAEFTETQARADLDKHEGRRPSIRALASAWGWNKSRTERFLSRVDSETARETDETAPTREQMKTLLTNGLADFNAKIGAKDEAAIIEHFTDRAMARIAGEDADGHEADEFDWHSESDRDSVVLPEQRQTAIYFNRSGELVIRQEKAWDQEDDSFIYIGKANAQAFLDRLCDVMGIPSVP